MMKQLDYIAPHPNIWHKIHLCLTDYWQNALRRAPSKPPIPLILNGWVFSSDFEKKNRWNETLQWAEMNNCMHLIPDLSEEEKYFG